MEDLQREEIGSVIDDTIANLLMAAHVEAPPVDAIALARGHLGMEICLDRRQPQRGRAHRAAGHKHIYLRPEPSVERHQWTVAHEIGEYFKPALLERLGVEPERTRVMAGESLASLFAYHLLVPACWFSSDAPLLAYDLLELKKRYATASHEVIACRLLDLPQPCIIAIVDNEHVHRRRSNAWPVRKQLEGAEQKCQEYVHYFSRPRRVQENGWTVQCWPIHQADWKREVLRSVVEPE